jgi:hypothetical protein
VLHAAKLPKFDKAGLTHELRQRLTDWRSLLDAEPVKARQIVRKLVDERIVFEPDPTRRLYTFKGQAAYGRLLTGTVLQKEWCPRGDSNTRYAVWESPGGITTPRISRSAVCSWRQIDAPGATQAQPLRSCSGSRGHKMAMKELHLLEVDSLR